MRAVWSTAVLLYTLASLLLVQVLATPKAHSNSARSKDIDARGAIRHHEARRTDSSVPGLEIRLVSRTVGTQPNVDVRDWDHIADTPAKSRRDKVHIERDHIADKDQAWTTRLEREATSGSPATEKQNGESDKSSLVLRSAAPKVFGISIYLVIAWLALMYLMYRTGSI